MKTTNYLENSIPNRAINAAENSRVNSKKIDSVAKDMESLFLHQMIKAMREAGGASNVKGLGSNTYNDMFDMEIANTMAERGIGIKEIFVKQLSRSNLDAKEQLNIPSLKVNKSFNIPTQSRVRASYSPENGDYDTAKIIKDLDKSISKSIDKAEAFKVRMPIKGIVSSEYGMREHPISGEPRFHHGIDIAANEGTPIYPVKGGEVIFSGQQHGYGNVVIIKHPDGYVTKYAHCEENFVSKGDMVDINTLIARVGSTGDATGSHLHFEVAHNGRSINPREIFIRG